MKHVRLFENFDKTTKVQFLVNEKDPKNKDLFAYFPEEIHHGEYLTSYSHVGQHSSVHPDYAARSRPATPEEYQDLKTELESIGYELEVLNDLDENARKAGTYDKGPPTDPTVYDNEGDVLNEEMYTVMNVTDGVPASPEVFTEEKADKFIQEFPKRFRGQGYYLTSNNERIDPYDIKLEKVPVESGATEGAYEAKENITMRGQYGDFKLEKGEQIHISPGKMSKNDYTVKMPDGVTQIKAEPINDLISAGRLQQIEA